MDASLCEQSSSGMTVLIEKLYPTYMFISAESKPEISSI